MGKHHSSSLQPPDHATAIATVTSEDAAVNAPAKLAPPIPAENRSKPQINGSKLTKKTKKRFNDDAASCSSSEVFSCTTRNRDNGNSSIRGIRIASVRRNPRFSVRRAASDVEALAFPLGMSIAAVLAQVLERKDLKNEKASVDQLSTICTSAVRESLSNVFGDKFDAFASNFEKSFGSTLSTLRLVRNSSVDHGEDQVSQSNPDYCSPDTTSTASLDKGECSFRSSDLFEHCTESMKCDLRVEEHSVEEVEDGRPSVSMNRELSLQGHMCQETGSVVSNTRGYSGNLSMLTTIEKSVAEQTRANDLKSLEIGLIMRKLKLKETQLALNSDSNFLERCKLYLGVSRTSFKAEKFKTQLEETRHSELLRACADLLVAGLLIMLACLGYGVYAFSYDKIYQLTRSCSPVESKSWWIPKPMASFNSGLQFLNCQVQVYSRMLFGLLMILAIAYVLTQRAAISRDAMPITFIVLLLGVVCGIAGKFCVDTLGGDGNDWLMFWEVLCSLHFFANVFTSYVFYILNGPVQVCQSIKCYSVFPYQIRRCLFYLILLLVPICCGLLPFASPKTWWEEHFSKLIRNHQLGAYDENHDSGIDFHE